MEQIQRMKQNQLYKSEDKTCDIHLNNETCITTETLVALRKWEKYNLSDEDVDDSDMIC